MAGQDYDHGTGHGVGAFLSVHEGPQRLSRISEVPLEPGMILSNEPGYYREGAFGIRLENLIVVQEAPPLPGGDDRRQLGFETLTFVPFDRRLIRHRPILSPGERDWLNAYHAETFAKLSGPRVSAKARDWLAPATAAALTNAPRSGHSGRRQNRKGHRHGRPHQDPQGTGHLGDPRRRRRAGRDAERAGTDRRPLSARSSTSPAPTSRWR